MVSASLSDALCAPSRLLQALYNQHRSSGTSTEFPEVVHSHFANIFAEHSLDQVRDINLQCPPNPEQFSPRSLVKFRGMVQDTTPSPEYYLSELPEGRCGGWSLADLDSPSDDLRPFPNLLKERTTYWAVSVPGESDQILSDSHSGLGRKPAPFSYKYPLPDASHLGLQVKLYTDPEKQGIRPTDLLTFVGLLSFENASFIEQDGSQPDSWLVPTLHVLTYFKDLRVSIPDDRSYVHEVLAWLAEYALGGDADAAQWILLAAVCSVLTRDNAAIKPTIALVSFPLPQAPLLPVAQPILVKALETILPLFTPISLSQPLLSDTLICPKTTEKGDLRAGLFQLPKQSTVLLSEHLLPLGLGWADESAKQKIQAAQQVMDSQTLTYDFPFSAFRFPTDLRFLIITPHPSSQIFRAPISVVIRSSDSRRLYDESDRNQRPSTQSILAIRNLIKGANLSEISISEDCSQYIQDDFVRARKQDKLVTGYDLNCWVSFAKAKAWLDGRKQVEIEIWTLMRQLDERRRKRL